MHKENDNYLCDERIAEHLSEQMCDGIVFRTIELNRERERIE